MKKNTLILIISTLIALLSGAILAVGPITNKKIGTNWGYQNCGLISDQIDLLEHDSQRLKDMRYLCRRQKAMYDMEYCAFIINVIAGFICADLALLHYMEISKDFEVKAGFISCAGGLIGFVLSLVYVCYSGYMFTHDIAYLDISFDHDYFDYQSYRAIEKLYSNGASQKWDGKEYVYEYEKDRRAYAKYIKYKDLGKKQYNYDDDYYKKYQGYIEIDGDIYNCHENAARKTCSYLYPEPETETSNRELYNRWLTALILACFVVLFDLFLAVLGLFSLANFGSFLE